MVGTIWARAARATPMALRRDVVDHFGGLIHSEHVVEHHISVAAM